MLLITYTVDRSLGGTVDSTPAGDMDVCLL